jgi:hypothetical protein
MMAAWATNMGIRLDTELAINKMIKARSIGVN